MKTLFRFFAVFCAAVAMILSFSSCSKDSVKEKKLVGKWESESYKYYEYDKDGNVVAIYKSQKEAAQKNYMSTCAMWHWCHGRRKDSYALDGYKYVLEEG